MHGPLVALISILSLCHFAAGLPAGATAARQVRDVRQDTSSPLFPPEVPSCAVCQPAWSGVSSCAEAAPVFSDWMNILWNPLSFIDAIKCSCTDTFSSAFPQCVDCFIRTDQCEAYLGVPSVEANTSPILDSMRNVCGFASVLLGGVASSQSSAESAAEPTTDWSDLSSGMRTL
ncbi:uncharacterized protein JCM10292_006543 [Rhodotorula paludigena]|uniref:uncharacterized protein n=1 Tax=Rhodotorula paludigena TaxID=86838 RepID=UPI00317DEA9E